MELPCWALFFLLLLTLDWAHCAPVIGQQHRMPTTALQALSNRGTLILEVALKGALQALEKAVREQQHRQQECRGCALCLFPECSNKTKQCSESQQLAMSEPTCEVILAAHAQPDALERSWALSRACGFYQMFCPEGNHTQESCVQAMAGHCNIRLQECRLESDMDYLNTSPEDENTVTCGEMLPSTSNSTGAKSRIVGGSVTKPGSWPWLVNIRLNGELMCGGVLLGDLWVLTAAHCFTGNLNELHWTVVIGQYDLSKEAAGEKVLQVNRILMHPKFNQKTFNNDLALLELRSPATACERARPVCLPTVSEEPAAGTSCYIAGWGSLYEDGPPSDVAMEARVPILSQESCRGTLGKDMLTNTMFCAGYLSGGIDSCQGDSGGPLTCQDPVSKRYVLYGITSWGDGCGERGKPGVYTRVTAFNNWISLQMNKSPPSREPTCFELVELTKAHDKSHSSEFTRLCSFYKQLCPAPLSEEACTRLIEEKCRQKQKRCELRTYLQSLLDLLRRAEDFLRHNMDFSFFTQTIPQFMEQMYNNVFPSRIRREITEQIPETEILDSDDPQSTLSGLTVSDSKNGNCTNSTKRLHTKDIEFLFQNLEFKVENLLTLIHRMAANEASEPFEQKTKGNLNAEDIFMGSNDDTVKELKAQGLKTIHKLKAQLSQEGVSLNDLPALDVKPVADHFKLQKRDVTTNLINMTGYGIQNYKGCRGLEEAIRNVESVKERYKWILQVPEQELTMDFQEILVDLGSKNEKGLYRGRVRVRVAGISTSFVSLVGLENSSFYRSMPGLIALSMDSLKT
ncbi:serine protease 56 [Bombina bombina]|uniref:serine protease 56 n=1 Tax=Bombina bombina TaxID=8345 RepID=UPI00235AE80E|nr:serine protease 56 [Bombina bombina]